VVVAGAFSRCRAGEYRDVNGASAIEPLNPPQAWMLYVLSQDETAKLSSVQVRHRIKYRIVPSFALASFFGFQRVLTADLGQLASGNIGGPRPGRKGDKPGRGPETLGGLSGGQPRAHQSYVARLHDAIKMQQQPSLI
jgi:hypothetical protein